MGALFSFMGAEQGNQVSNTTPLEFIQQPYTKEALNYYIKERQKTLNPNLKKNTEKYETYSDNVLQDTLEKQIEDLNSNTSGVTDEEKNKQLLNIKILVNMKKDITILDNILNELYDLDCITKAETKQIREVLTSIYEKIKNNILKITRSQMIILLKNYEVEYEINYRTLNSTIMKTCPTLVNLILSKRFNQPRINLYNIIRTKFRYSVPYSVPAPAAAPAAASAGGNKTNKYKSKYKGKGITKTKGKGKMKTKYNKRI